MAIDLCVNGVSRSVPVAASPALLDTVLTALRVRRELVAIALNDTIVSRSEWNSLLVSSGDRVEIVHFVGGGSSSEHIDPTRQ